MCNTSCTLKYCTSYDYLLKSHLQNSLHKKWQGCSLTEVFAKELLCKNGDPQKYKICALLAISSNIHDGMASQKWKFLLNGAWQSISNPVNQLHEIHMPERMAYTWKWIQSLFCALLHWIRSVPGRCDDVVVVVRFGTYKVGFQVKERASPVVFVGRNTSVVFIILLYYGRLLSHHVWLTGIFAFVLKCPHSVDSFH